MIKFEDYLEAVREAVEMSEAKKRDMGEISSSDIKEVNGVLTYRGKVLKTLGGQTVSAGSKHARKLMNLLSQGLWKDMYKNVLKNNQGPMFKYSEDFEDDDFDELYEAQEGKDSLSRKLIKELETNPMTYSQMQDFIAGPARGGTNKRTSRGFWSSNLTKLVNSGVLKRDPRTKKYYAKPGTSSKKSLYAGWDLISNASPTQNRTGGGYGNPSMNKQKRDSM